MGYVDLCIELVYQEYVGIQVQVVGLGYDGIGVCLVDVGGQFFVLVLDWVYFWIECIGLQEDVVVFEIVDICNSFVLVVGIGGFGVVFFVVVYGGCVVLVY